MKKCSKCEIEKPFTDFQKHSSTRDGWQGVCRACRRTHQDGWINQNREEIRGRKKVYYEKNKDALSAAVRDWHRRHSNHLREYRKQYKNSRKHDPDFKLARALRSRLASAIRGGYKSGSAVRDLGCSIPALKLHLESQFKGGMSWDNWSPTGWHIDHIVPLVSFDLSDNDELRRACHFTNLRPMWSTENLRKGGRKIA